VPGFKKILIAEIARNIPNRYQSDNWDIERFGDPKDQTNQRVSSINLRRTLRILRKINGFSITYDLLENEYSRGMFVKVLVFRILGYRKMMLPLNTPEYWSKREKPLSMILNEDVIDIGTHNWSLSGLLAK